MTQHRDTMNRLADLLGPDIVIALDPAAAERIARLRQPLPCECDGFFSRLVSESETLKLAA